MLLLFNQLLYRYLYIHQTPLTKTGILPSLEHRSLTFFVFLFHFSVLVRIQTYEPISHLNAIMWKTRVQLPFKSVTI